MQKVSTAQNKDEGPQFVPDKGKDTPEFKSQHESARSQHAGSEESKQAGKDLREGTEKAEARKAQQAPKGAKTPVKSGTKQLQKTRDNFENTGRLGQPPGKLAATSLAGLSALAKAQAPDEALKNQKPADAISLLKQAQERGTLVQEDGQREGHTEDQDDPELAAAVEICIQKCFGVRGILRIGPGKNESQEPIIVVVATHGFGKASLGSVPEKVSRFSTVVAIPFELLPLKREQ